MSLVKKNVGWLGVLCLLGAGALAVFVPWLTRLRWILAIAGAVLLLASLVLNAREAQGVLGRRGTRYGAGAAVMILLALGVVVFANALSSRHSVRWDFTENRRNTLSPQTVQVLKTLKTPVEAIAFFRTDTPGKRTAEDLLGQYAAQSGGKFTWRLEDTDKAPGLAREYGVESYGTVVIKGGGPDAARTEKILDAEEEKLTNALVKVTRSGKRTVYVIKGHGEREVTNTERAGFSQARDQMDKANYEVKELLLAREPKVPDDAAVVIVPGPKTDLFPQEIAALDAYIARGGKAFFMATPFSGRGPPHVPREVRHPPRRRRGHRVEPARAALRHGPARAHREPVRSAPDHQGSRRGDDALPADPIGRGGQESPEGHGDPAARQDQRPVVGRDGQVRLLKGEAKPDPGEKRGPLAVALVATVDVEGKPDAKPEGAEPKKPVKARIVVVGTADFASNQFLGAQGNKDFFLNVVSWLAEEEDLLSVRPKDTKQNPIVLTSAQSNLVLWLPLAILPGAVVICGMMVMARRRRTS